MADSGGLPEITAVQLREDAAAAAAAWWGERLEKSEVTAVQRQEET